MGLETVAVIPEAKFVPTTQIALLASEKPALLIAGGVILAGSTSDARVEATPSVTTRICNVPEDDALQFDGGWGNAGRLAVIHPELP